MNIDSNHKHTNFSSKKRGIREADDIVRLLNKKYPRTSKTNIEDFHNVSKRPFVVDNLDFKTFQLRSAVSTKRLYAKNKQDMIKALPDSVSKYRIGSCFESAELCSIAAKVNGIKDYKIGKVYSNETGSLDHAVLIVEDKKNPYILDAWLGFADYVPNAIKRFQKEFSNHFNFSGTRTEKIFIDTSHCETYQESLVKDFSQEELRAIFPELVTK